MTFELLSVNLNESSELFEFQTWWRHVNMVAGCSWVQGTWGVSPINPGGTTHELLLVTLCHMMWQVRSTTRQFEWTPITPIPGSGSSCILAHRHSNKYDQHCTIKTISTLHPFESHPSYLFLSARTQSRIYPWQAPLPAAWQQSTNFPQLVNFVQYFLLELDWYPDAPCALPQAYVGPTPGRTQSALDPLVALHQKIPLTPYAEEALMASVVATRRVLNCMVWYELRERHSVYSESRWASGLTFLWW